MRRYIKANANEITADNCTVLPHCGVSVYMHKLPDKIYIIQHSFDVRPTMRGHRGWKALVTKGGENEQLQLEIFKMLSRF